MKAKKQIKVIILLDASLVESLTKQLESRGTDIETCIRLQLKAFSRSSSLATLQSKMPFGKYAGELVEDICRADPEYLKWILANGKAPAFDLDVLRLLEELDKVKG